MSRLPPHSDQCDNTSEIWTCPGCYVDMNVSRPGTYTCPNCDRLVECSIVQEPRYRAALVEEGED